MIKYRCIVAYEGTRYCGFQTQAHSPSIQSELERVLRIFTRDSQHVWGASRTDSGVHAQGQQIMFATNKSPFQPDKWQYSLNCMLPPDIRLGPIEVCPAGFHPIYDAQSKAYVYRFWRGLCYTPWLAPYVWNQHVNLDFAKIEEAIPYLLGTHDFTSFCAQDTTVKTRTRTLFDIRAVPQPPYYEFWFLGSGFLKQMIRILVGTLFDIGLGKISPSQIPDILARQDRRASGQTAPACGLMLQKIYYGAQVTSLDTLLGLPGPTTPGQGIWMPF